MTSERFDLEKTSAIDTNYTKSHRFKPRKWVATFRVSEECHLGHLASGAWETRSMSRLRPHSLVEPEIHHVVVLHHVRFEFQSLFAGAFGLRLTARLHKIRKADDLGADESLLDIGVDRGRRFPRRQAGADGPRAVFLAAHRQKTEVAALRKGPHQQRIGRGQFGLPSHHHGLVRIK